MRLKEGFVGRQHAPVSPAHSRAGATIGRWPAQHGEQQRLKERMELRHSSYAAGAQRVTMVSTTDRQE